MYRRVAAATAVAALLLAGSLNVRPAVAEDPAVAAKHDLLSRTLDTRKIDLDLDEVPLKEALAQIGRRAGVSLVLDPRAAEAQGEEPVSLAVTALTAANALRIVCDYVKLTYTFRNGVVWVTTPEAAAKSETVLRIYDVRDVTNPIRNFAGTRIRLRANEGTGGGVEIIEEPETPVPTAEELQDTIPEVIGGESWKSNPEASIMQVSGMLIVRQTPAVHRQIAELLNQLRANR